MNIIIVDDHAMVREGFKALLEQEGIAEKVSEASNGKEFMDLLKYQKADLVLMDIEMPVMNGLEATQKALEAYPELKILVLTMFSNLEYYNRFVSLGVKGFILKSSSKRELEYAIRAISEGDNYFSGELLQKIIHNISNQPRIEQTTDNGFKLTERELETLKLLCEGYSTNEIAEVLHLSPKTIETHRARLLFKTDSKNTINLVMFAIKNGYIKP